jgi:predicted DNA-binding protein with PD1-like motif
MAGHNQKSYRIALQRGKTLYDCVADALTTLGIRAGALNIEHAAFDHISYFLITSSPDVEPVAHYTTPLELNERAMLVGAGATIGQTGDGKPAIHCHGLVVTESGRQVGGHLLTDRCTLAEEGVAYISALNFMDLVIGVDPEIATPVFQPKYCEATS